MVEVKHSFVREFSMEEYKKVDFNIYYIDNDTVIFSVPKGDDKVYNLPRCKGATSVEWEEAVICLNGSSEGCINGQLQQLKRNTLTLMPSHFIVSDVNPRNDVEWLVICVSKTKFKQLMGSEMEKWNQLTYQNRIKTIHLRSVDVDGLVMCAEKIKSLNTNDVYYRKKVNLLLQWMLFSILGYFLQQVKLTELVRGKEHQMGHGNQLFQQFLDLLVKITPKHRPVSFYSDSLSITSKYLTELCKKYSGKTAKDWIQEYTLDEVRFYLSQPNLSIKQVMGLTGFDSISFFSAYVKNYLNCSPSEFRHKIHKDKTTFS